MLFHRPGPTKIVRFGAISRICRIASAKIGLMTSVVAASLGSFKSSKAKPRRRFRVMLGDLAPDRQEPGRLLFGVGCEIVKVMDVDHHAQTLAQPGIDQFIGTGEDFGADSELGPGPV